MPLFANAAALRIVDAMAIVLNQALQLARIRIASAAPSVLRMMVERDHAASEAKLLRQALGPLQARQCFSAWPPVDHLTGFNSFFSDPVWKSNSFPFRS